MMGANEILRMLQAGPIRGAVCLPGVEEYDDAVDSGMVVDILSGLIHDDLLKLHIDGSPYEAHNRAVGKRSYFDKSGNPTLDAWEAGAWGNGRHTFYLDAGGDVEHYFSIAVGPEADLRRAFMAQSKEPSYVLWLEARVIAAERGTGR